MSTFPDATAVIACPVDGCTGILEIELQVNLDDGALHVTVAGFKDQGQHSVDHPDLWLKL